MIRGHKAGQSLIDNQAAESVFDSRVGLRSVRVALKIGIHDRIEKELTDYCRTRPLLCKKRHDRWYVAANAVASDRKTCRVNAEFLGVL